MNIVGNIVIVDNKPFIVFKIIFSFSDLDNVEQYEGRLEFLAYLIDHSHADDTTQVMIGFYSPLLAQLA